MSILHRPHPFIFQIGAPANPPSLCGRTGRRKNGSRYAVYPRLVHRPRPIPPEAVPFFSSSHATPSAQPTARIPK